MKAFKRKILRIFFAFEVTVFAVVYVFGVHGIQSLLRLQKENESLEADVRTLHHEVRSLESETQSWHAHAFYKEKIAREQLQMARSDDQVYYVTS